MEKVQRRTFLHPQFDLHTKSLKGGADGFHISKSNNEESNSLGEDVYGVIVLSLH